MTRQRKILLPALHGAALLGLLITGAAARAAIHTAVYTGIVSDGLDVTGVFGAPLASLDDLPFVATFRYDTALGDRTTLRGQRDTIVGGSTYGVPTMITEATLRIAGITVAFDRDYYGLADAAHGFVQTGNGHYFDDGITYNWDTLTAGAAVSGAPPSLEWNMSALAWYGGGAFQLNSIDLASGQFLRRAGGSLLVTWVTTSGGTGATNLPEPASWALMIAGFGMVGATLRRSRAMVGGQGRLHRD